MAVPGPGHARIAESIRDGKIKQDMDSYQVMDDQRFPITPERPFGAIRRRRIGPCVVDVSGTDSFSSLARLSLLLKDFIMDSPFSCRHAALCWPWNKGITLTPPVIGRIAAGHTVVRETGPCWSGTITSPSRASCRTGIPAFGKSTSCSTPPSRGEAKRVPFPVRTAYNDVNLNLHNSYSAFDSKTGRVLCVGNGDRARRVTAEGGVKSTAPPRGLRVRPASRAAKNFSRAYFRVGGRRDELVFLLRTTSFNSLDRLGCRLNQLSGLTGGTIANMPMLLILRQDDDPVVSGEPITLQT